MQNEIYKSVIFHIMRALHEESEACDFLKISCFAECFSIKRNALVFLEINKSSLGQHLSCEKLDVMLSVLFHHMYNAH